MPQRIWLWHPTLAKKQQSNADNSSQWPRENHWECPLCVSAAEPAVATVSGRLCSSENRRMQSICGKKVAQAQVQNTDISPVVDRLSLIGQNGRNRVISRATREISTQWKLLELQEVIYLRWAEEKLSATGRMVPRVEITKTRSTVYHPRAIDRLSICKIP